MNINKEWHLKNKMPKNPTLEQRVEWHLEHLKHCRCSTDLPNSIEEELKKLGLKIPQQKQQLES